MKVSQFPRKQIILTLTVLLVGSGSFFCGRLSVMYKKEPLHIDEGPPISEQLNNALSEIQEPGNSKPAPDVQKEGSEGSASTQPSENGSLNGSFVASKSGEKYYPIDCGSAQRIKEENRVYFATAEEAEAAGYELTTACGN